MVKASRVLTLAAVAALAVPGVSLAAAHGSAQSSSPRSAAAGLHNFPGSQLKWVKFMLAHATAKARRSTMKPHAEIGNFGQCPKLPAGAKAADWECVLIHITGGVLDLGASHQILNREITLSFASNVNDQSLLQGTLKSSPMPVLGGIFETPEVDQATSKDKNLQLHVQPFGVSEALDPTGQALLITGQRVKVINPVFGSTCFIGTTKHPIVISPTIGTTNPPPPNQPETGSLNALEQVGHEGVIIATVVDNAFAAPAASGCGPVSNSVRPLNRVVNAVAGLPAAAGNNNAVFQTTTEIIGYRFI
jgi:hypothetical protein